MTKEMTNYGIIQLYNLLNEVFYENASNYIPVKAGFFIKRNIETLRKLCKEIDTCRIEICDRYGELSEDGSQYNFPEEKVDKVNNELETLFNICQNVELETISFEDVQDIKMSMQQIEVLSVMMEQA